MEIVNNHGCEAWLTVATRRDIEGQLPPAHTGAVSPRRYVEQAIATADHFTEGVQTALQQLTPGSGPADESHDTAEVAVRHERLLRVR